MENQEKNKKNKKQTEKVCFFFVKNRKKCLTTYIFYDIIQSQTTKGEKKMKRKSEKFFYYLISAIYENQFCSSWVKAHSEVEALKMFDNISDKYFTITGIQTISKESFEYFVERKENFLNKKQETLENE